MWKNTLLYWMPSKRFARRYKLKKPNRRINFLEAITVMMPEEVANLSLPAPELVSYYRNQQSRTFWICGEIDSGLLEIINNILLINKEDAENCVPVSERVPIKILIFTDGGELDPTFSLIDAIQMSQTPVITVNAGKCMSAGFLLLIAGHERYAYAHSESMYHSGSGGLVGDYEKVRSAMENYERTVTKMQNYTLSRTIIPAEDFEENKANDWYFTPEQMVKYGIVDKVLTSIDEIL